MPRYKNASTPLTSKRTVSTDPSASPTATVENLLTMEIPKIIEEIIKYDKNHAGGNVEKKKERINLLISLQEKLTSTTQELLETRENLKMANQELTEVKENLNKANEANQELRHQNTILIEGLNLDKIQHVIHRTLEEALQKPANLSPPMDQNNKLSYAEVVQYPFLPKKDPAIIITPKSAEATRKIKQELNTLDTENIEISDCITTKKGQIIITCNDAGNRNKLLDKIKEKDVIKEKSVIRPTSDKPPKLIIIGAPRFHLDQPYFIKNKENEEQVRQYQEHFLDDPIKKILKDTNTTYNIFKINLTRNGKLNIIIELENHQDVHKLLLHKQLLIGFNKCQITKYIQLIRCYNCQRFKHSASTCTYSSACANCAGEHVTHECTDTTHKNTKCVNCEDLALFLKKKNKEWKHINIYHPASDPNCFSYRREFNNLKDFILK